MTSERSNRNIAHAVFMLKQTTPKLAHLAPKNGIQQTQTRTMTCVKRAVGMGALSGIARALIRALLARAALASALRARGTSSLISALATWSAQTAEQIQVPSLTIPMLRSVKIAQTRSRGARCVIPHTLTSLARMFIARVVKRVTIYRTIFVKYVKPGSTALVILPKYRVRWAPTRP